MPPTPLPRPEKLRALVVYGHRPTADTLGQLFTACGHDVLVAYEEVTACILARKHRPEVVLLDLRLHGPEMARRLRQQPGLQDIAVVAITEAGGEAAAQRCVEHGFAHYLVEPVDPVQVHVLLRKLRTPR